MADLPPRYPPSSRSSSGSARWFCEVGKEQHGPMEFRELRIMALEQELLGHDQVWKEDNKERQSALSVVGLIPAAKKKVVQPPPSEVSDADPYAAPKARAFADGPPGGLYLPHLHRANFPIFFFLLLLTAGLFYTGWKIPDPDTKPLIYSLAGLGLAFWLFLSLLYLHRAWEMMKMFGAPIDGNKAVRFILLPVFNALWCFVALFSWARLWNRSIKTQPGLALASKVWPPFFFLFPILFLISQALLIMYVYIKESPGDLSNQSHQIAIGVWALTLLNGLACWFQLSQSINFLARKKS